VYLDAYLISDDQSYLDTALDIAKYLTTPPMQSSIGGFFSSEDADSLYRLTQKEKREGAFYVWTTKEFQSVLGDRDGDVLAKYYNVQENGNVQPENDAHDELISQNVLSISCTESEIGKESGIAPADVKRIIQEGRTKLLEHRNRERPRPALDDKIVVAWNGLAIGALARLSVVLSTVNPNTAPAYLEAAKKAAKFIRAELYDETSGTMRRVYREGPGDAPAFADDYAFLISGLIDLYEATFDDSYLEFADVLQSKSSPVFFTFCAFEVVVSLKAFANPHAHRNPK
jgi:uncharacterized protein YyaL (SSP411 family)